MKRSGGFSFLGIFYGLLISIGGSMLFGGIIGGVLGFNFGREGYAPDRIQSLVMQEMQREPLLLVLLLASGLWLLMGSFIVANAAGSSSVMAFVHAGVVGLVNFLLNLPVFWESLGVSYGDGAANDYVWIGPIIALPIALIGAVLSVLTAEESPPARSTHSTTRDGDYSTYR